MKKFIANYTKLLNEAVRIGENINLTPTQNNINNVIICGMGGSGIGGNIVSEITALECTVPITVIKDYFLPQFINEKTLTIISSYSGDTEETLNALEEAIKKRTKIVCITSGGKMRKIAENLGIDMILVPPGMPPRAALPYSLTQLLYTLNFHKLISSSFKRDLQMAVKLIDAEEVNIIKDAAETSFLLKDRITIIYGTSGMEGIAIRFRQQINENSKALCWHNVFPELNHNEIQGWKDQNDQLAVVIFRNNNEYLRTSKRIEISKDIIENYDIDIKEVFAKGITPIENMLYLIHWGDWTSYFIAEIKGLDTMDIEAIHYLKNELAKI